MRKPVVLLLLGLVASHSVKLPDRLADEPGAFPVGLYWAYNNVLSTDAGLDFQPYAGKQVTATLYQVTDRSVPGPAGTLRARINELFANRHEASASERSSAATADPITTSFRL